MRKTEGLLPNYSIDAGYADVARRRLAEELEQQTGPLFAGVSVASN